MQVGQRPKPSVCWFPPRPKAESKVISSAPEFAQSIIVDLKGQHLPDGLTQGTLSPEATEEAKRSVVAAGMLASTDEKAGKDLAMGEPGKVVQNNLTEYFEMKGKGKMEAVLVTPAGKDGNPGVLYVNVDDSGIQSFGFSDKGDQVEVRATFLKPVGKDQFEGYTITGFRPDPSN